MDDPYAGRRVGSWFWAFAPLYTCGFGTAPAMIGAAIHKRSAWQAFAALVYTVALIATVVGMGSTSESTSALAGISILLNWFGGLIHAQVIRKWVFDLPDRPPRPVYPGMGMPMPVVPPPPPPSLVPPASAMPAPPPMPPRLGPPPVWAHLSPIQAQQQAALAAAMDLKHARDFSRNLAANNPQLAYQLQIGRVDIPNRAFPDGGLVDVNNVPADALAAATGLPLEMAQRIEAVSDQVNGFGSVEDLCAQTQLPPQTFDHLLDTLYFPPRLPD